MSTNKNDGAKSVLLVIGAYIVTLMVTILIIGLATTNFIDTTKCSSLSRALLVLWGTIAVVFLASIFVVRVITWKIIQSTSGRLVIVAVYGAVMLVSFAVLAFMLLVLFNC